jgi:hypothetical protein
VSARHGINNATTPYYIPKFCVLMRGLQQIFHRDVAHGLPACERDRISLDGAGHGLGALIKLAGTIACCRCVLVAKLH